jgi:hypothetical protein
MHAMLGKNAGCTYVIVSREFSVGWNIYFGLGLHTWTSMYSYKCNFEIFYNDRWHINENRALRKKHALLWKNAICMYVVASPEFGVGWNIHFGLGLHAWTNMCWYIYNYKILYSDRW